jgi:hypothetical protein
VAVTNPGGSPGGLANGFTYVAPGGFGKSSPGNTTAGLTSDVTLSWLTLEGATYRVCVDTSNNSACDTGWRTALGWSSIGYAGLANGTYYWQVLADTSAGTTQADGGAWWSLTVGGGGGVPTPTITGVTSSSGSTAGGTPVTITGSSFQAGATVTFGGVAATSVSVNSTTSIAATTPPGSAGAVTVAVTNPGGSPGSLASGFTYVTPGGFSKTGPGDGASGLTSEITVSWTAVAGATYRVCIDTVNNGVCDTGWRRAMTWTALGYSGVGPGTYYWQVLADAPAGTVAADGGAWFSFTVSGAPVMVSLALPLEFDALAGPVATSDGVFVPEPPAAMRPRTSSIAASV